MDVLDWLDALDFDHLLLSDRLPYRLMSPEDISGDF